MGDFEYLGEDENTLLTFRFLIWLEYDEYKV